MYQSKSKIFTIANLFPTEIKETERFLLSLLYLSVPFHETALKKVLKPLYSDDLATKTIRELTKRGYIHKRETNQGKFYALTAKTLRYLDYNRTKASYRKQPIADKMLLTYKIQSSILADMIITVCAAKYLKAWERAPSDYIEEYLKGCKAFDPVKFGYILEKQNLETIDVLPRNLICKTDLIEIIENMILQGKLPFTKYYKTALYVNSTEPHFKKMHIYDTAQKHIQSLSAEKYLLEKQPDCHMEYLKVRKDLEIATKSINDIADSICLFSYCNGQKILTLSILEQNGVFIESIADKDILFGILDNSSYSLAPKTLNARLDYCLTLANQISHNAQIAIYTTQEQEGLLKMKLKTSLEGLYTPKIKIIVIEDKMKYRYQTWLQIKKEI